MGWGYIGGAYLAGSRSGWSIDLGGVDLGVLVDLGPDDLGRVDLRGI